MNDASRPPAASYLSGFGNEFATEALAGALPVGQNSPQRAPYGLYAEQLSGTAFTAPRSQNRRSWLYRIRPAAMHGAVRALVERRRIAQRRSTTPPTPPNQLRWDPLPMPDAPTDFVDGLVTMAGNGSAGRAARLRDPPVRGQPVDARSASSTTPTASC